MLYKNGQLITNSQFKTVVYNDLSPMLMIIYICAIITISITPKSK
jgi:hypothetical protein